jgi:hypothetical protein
MSTAPKRVKKLILKCLSKGWLQTGSGRFMCDSQSCEGCVLSGNCPVYSDGNPNELFHEMKEEYPESFI